MGSGAKNKPAVLLTSVLSDGGVYSARALAQSGYRVITSDFAQLPLAFRPRYAQHHETISGRSREQFETEFLDLIGRHKPEAVLNFGTSFTRASIVHRATIEKTTAVLAPEMDAFEAAYDKTRCMEECTELGIPSPRSYSVGEARELLGAATRRGEPIVLVVKPDVDAGGGSGIRYVRTTGDLEAAVARCETDFGGALLQEWIPGDATAMKTVVLLFDREGNLDAAFTTRKVRQWPQSGGCTALSVSTADPGLVRQVLPFFEKHRWQGAAEVELKYDARDGLDKVIEINPRMPAYMRFAGLCGWDLPVRAVELAMGDRASGNPALTFSPGSGYCRPGFFVSTCMDDLRGSGLRSAIARAWTDWREVRPSLRDSLRDPVPMIGRILHQITRNPGSAMAQFPGVETPPRQGPTSAMAPHPSSPQSAVR